MNEVRIIGGMWKRRKLGFPDRPTLRPTPDRTRETLFNWLAPSVVDARCLDLYAGSGALGFEALSRGAAHVTFVERDPAAVAALRTNQRRLNAVAASVIARSAVLPWLDRQRQQWDLVFLDPPYQSDQLDRALTRLLEGGMLAPGALIAIDLPARAAPPGAPFQQLKETRAGDARLLLMRAMEV